MHWIDTRMPSSSGQRRPVAAIVPAKDEAERIASTIEALRRVDEVDLVVVVDDGSTDDTARLALASGAAVVRHRRNHGKAAALASGVREVADQERAAGETAHHLLFVDADLEDSAAELGLLIRPVQRDETDMTIATLPPQRTPAGGHGFVVRLARRGIADLTGWTPTQPLSGMRCLRRTAYLAAQPLARGWGVEVGMTIDVLAAGLRVMEVPCELHHRVTGASWREQVHRARQYRDVWLALARRRLRRGMPGARRAR